MGTPTDGPGISFDRIAAEYDASRGGVERAQANARDVAPHLVPGAVLEIGVGTGLIAQALAAQAPHISRSAGVDISPEMLALAARRLPGRVLRAAAQRLPFSDATFDDVVAVHVLHLVPDVTPVLREAVRVLRPGGRMVAIHGEPDPSDDDLGRVTSGLLTLGEPRKDSPAAVRDAAEALGLRCLGQHPTSPRIVQVSPAEIADMIARRTTSRLWDLDESAWRTHVQPVIDALGALPDQDRPRRQVDRTTVTVLERP